MNLQELTLTTSMYSSVYIRPLYASDAGLMRMIGMDT